VAATQSCPAGLALKVIGTLPAGITSTSSGISIPAGVFTSQVSQFDADLQAGSFLANLFTTNVVECGWYNTDQQFLCANGTTYDEPAGTFFSEISQADANAQAQAALTATCPCLNFSNLVWTHVTNIYYAGDGGPTYPNWNTGINTVGGNSASISCYCGTSAVSTNQYNNRFTQKYTATIPAVAGGGTCWARLTYAITLQGQAPQGPANSFWGYQIGSPNNFPTPPPTVSITVTGAGTYSTQVSDSGYLDFSYDSSQSFTVSFQVDGGSPYDQLSGSRFFPYSVTAVMSLAPSQHP
jgi:hypothetical protein